LTEQPENGARRQDGVTERRSFAAGRLAIALCAAALFYSALLILAVVGARTAPRLFPSPAEMQVRRLLDTMDGAADVVAAPGGQKPKLRKAAVKTTGPVAMPPTIYLPGPQVELARILTVALELERAERSVRASLQALRAAPPARAIAQEHSHPDLQQALQPAEETIETVRVHAAETRKLLAEAFTLEDDRAADVQAVLGFPYLPLDLSQFSEADVDVPLSSLPFPLRGEDVSAETIRQGLEALDAAPNSAAAEGELASLGLRGDAARSLILYRLSLLVERLADGESMQRVEEELAKYVALTGWQSKAVCCVAAHRAVLRRASWCFAELIGRLDEPPPMGQTARFLLISACGRMELQRGAERLAASASPAGDAFDVLARLGPFAASALASVAGAGEERRAERAAVALERVRKRWGEGEGAEALGSEPARWREWFLSARDLL